MADNELLKKGWCDKVFEGRNQDYGAYKLRKETGRRYGKALGCVGSLFLMIAAPIVIITIIFYQPIEYKDIGEDIQRIEGIRLKEARPVRRPKKASEPELGEKNVNITDVDPIEEMITVQQEEEIDEKKIEDLSKDSLKVLLKEEKLELAQNEERTDGIIVDSIPHYPGGITCFMKWLDSTMVYPPACIRAKIEGTVTVAFIVEPDGHTANPRILKGAHNQLNNEALRVIHMMKAWKPAKKNGKNVRAQVTLPIVFEILK